MHLFVVEKEVVSKHTKSYEMIVDGAFIVLFFLFSVKLWIEQILSSKQENSFL